MPHLLVLQRAKVIHRGCEPCFTHTATITYDGRVEPDGESCGKEVGKMRSEGKAYEGEDGDVFRF